MADDPFGDVGSSGGGGGSGPGTAVGGIYVIENTVSGGFYLGSSLCFRMRWKNHRSQLNRGTHHCPRLQTAWTKYGPAVFLFLALCDMSDDAAVRATEHRVLRRLVGHDRCYNATALPWSTDREKIRATKLAQLQTPEARFALAARLGNGTRPAHNKGKPMSVEQRALLSRVRTGQPSYIRTRPMPAESRARISAARKGNVPPNKGKRGLWSPSEEQRAKLSAAHKARWARMTPEERATAHPPRRRRPAHDEPRGGVA